MVSSVSSFTNFINELSLWTTQNEKQLHCNRI